MPVQKKQAVCGMPRPIKNAKDLAKLDELLDNMESVDRCIKTDQEMLSILSPMSLPHEAAKTRTKERVTTITVNDQSRMSPPQDSEIINRSRERLMNTAKESIAANKKYREALRGQIIRIFRTKGGRDIPPG